MKSLYHIYYTTQEGEGTRCEYATTPQSALNQAKEHFKLFGYGDETIEEVFKS